MSAKPLNTTEAWVHLYAPELLTEENREAIAPFLEADDLNGLAHFLGQRITIDQQEAAQSYSEKAQHMAKDFQFHGPLDASEITKEMETFAKDFCELFKREELNVELAADWLLELLSAEQVLEDKAIYDESPVKDFAPDFYAIEPTQEMFVLAFKCQEYLEQEPGRILPAAHWISRQVVVEAKQEETLQANSDTQTNLSNPPGRQMNPEEVEQHAQEVQETTQLLNDMLEQAKQEVERIEKLLAQKQKQSL